MSKISRRQYLTFLGLLGIQGLALDDWSTPKPALRRDDRVGLLSVTEKRRLWQCFAAIGQRSETKTDLDQAGFFAVLDLKTQQAPSYLAEYQMAVQTITATLGEQPSSDALDRLFKAEDPHFRQHVLLEFIQLHLVYGGFRAFGVTNYKGHMGGSFTPPAPLPYRGIHS